MATQYYCKNETRRRLVKDHLFINGIDYLEVLDRDAPSGLRQRILLVRFFKRIGADIGPSNVKIDGGTRIRSVEVQWAGRADQASFLSEIKELDDPEKVLLVRTRSSGDFSTYRLSLVNLETLNARHLFDPVLSEVYFSFKVECPDQLDCKVQKICPVETLPSPQIDYLSKDYSSFRRLMLDRISLLLPGWKERSPADLGVALVELLAYAGDNLSYYQDAVATEAYLDLSRKRVSARRHALLLDYPVNEGCNSRAWACFEVGEGSSGDTAVTLNKEVGQERTLLLTRCAKDAVLDFQDWDTMVSSRPEVFNLMDDSVSLYNAHNMISFYTWGDELCCLPKGATRATLLDNNNPNKRLHLRAGDVLIFEELKGLDGDDIVDPDPTHRHAVRLTRVDPEDREDPGPGGHTGPVNDVDVTPDGHCVVSASSDTTLKVWNLETGELMKTLWGHTDSVNGVVVTPDGEHAVSASSDRTLKVWDLLRGVVEMTLEGHANGVNGVDVTPDGRWAVSASSDSTLKVWDLETGEVLKTLEGHTNSVNDVAVGWRRITEPPEPCIIVDTSEEMEGTDLGGVESPKGAGGEPLPDMDEVEYGEGVEYVLQAVSASSDRTLKVWDLESGMVLVTLTGHLAGVNGVDLSSNGIFAVSASSDKTLKVWNLNTNEMLRTLEGHADRVNGVAMRAFEDVDPCEVPVGCYTVFQAVSASSDMTLKVWDLDGGEVLTTFQGHTASVNAVTLTPDWMMAVSGSSDRSIKVWDLRVYKFVGTLAGHSSGVNDVAVTPDKSRAVSVSADRTMKVWDLGQLSLLYTFPRQMSTILCVDVTADGMLAVTGLYDGTLKVWDLENWSLITTLRGHSSGVNGVAVTPQRDIAISASSDRTLKVWDLNSYSLKYTLQGHSSGVNAVAVTPDGRLAVSGSTDRTVRVWDLENQTLTFTLSGHTDRVSGVAVSSDGRFAISASWDKTLKVWDLESGSLSATLSGHLERVKDVALTSDGKIAVSASSDDTLKVWDVECKRVKLTLEGHTSEVNAVALVPDGSLVVSGSLDRTVKLWEIYAGGLIRTMEGSMDIPEYRSGVDLLTNNLVVEIEWHPEDALPFPLCLSAQVNGAVITEMSCARGNVALIDHGRRYMDLSLRPPCPGVVGRYRPHLEHRGITYSDVYNQESARVGSASAAVFQDPLEALPSEMSLTGDGEVWTPRRTLLKSDRFAPEFVVEMEDDGTGALLFGDDVSGKRPAGILKATYRVGNGTAGNIGADSIAHVVVPSSTAEVYRIRRVRNPLPAKGGTDPEATSHIRHYAPYAFRRIERAVTEADYAEVAKRHPLVREAVATLRWTGGWYTMFVTVDLVAGIEVDREFEAELLAFLEKFRLAGHDVEVEPPRYVPLDIAFTVHVKPDYLRSDVRKALLEIFSNVDLPQGRRGIFHPDNFTFAQPVYLSHLVAAVMGVPGVMHIDTSDRSPHRFRPWGRSPRDEIEVGMISTGRLEIARLDNDPNAPENGRVEFYMEGGL